jgi:hypothetical protein
VSVDLGPEVAEPAHQGQCRESLVVAQGRTDNVGREVRRELEVTGA